MKDLISIVVPCYNEEKNISRCLDSLLKQTYPNLEILVVDDGSKDNSKKIIKEYEKNDKRVKYLHKKNGGLSSARNYGIKYATGKYICFVDSDDYVHEDFVKKLYDAIIDNNVNTSICDICRIHKNHKSYNIMDENKVKLNIHPAAWNKMFKTSLFVDNKINFKEGIWYEDLATTPKLLLKENFAIVNEPLYYYIQNDNSIMHTYDDRIYQVYDALEEIEDYAYSNDLFDECIDILEFDNVYHVLIGTIYRASFAKDFNVRTIKKIKKYVNDKYPNWSKNKYIKNQSLIFKIYLLLIKLNFNYCIYIFLKIFNKKMGL